MAIRPHKKHVHKVLYIDQACTLLRCLPSSQVWHAPGSFTIMWLADAGSGILVHHIFNISEGDATSVGPADVWGQAITSVFPMFHWRVHLLGVF